MKIDLGRNGSIETKVEGVRTNKSIAIKNANGTSSSTVHLDLTEAVAHHAALGEAIKNVRKTT